MEHKKGSLKSTIAVSLTNYLDAGSIVAGASGLTLWQNYLGLTESHLGWLNAISANCFGAALGAIIGGFLADKYGRKTIYTYNMLVYMTGVAIIMFSVSFPMLLLGFLVTGISVGAGVPASWTYISESSEIHNRGRNIGISQFAWGVGPAIILFLGMLLAPTGILGNMSQKIGLAVHGNEKTCTLLSWDNSKDYDTYQVIYNNNDNLQSDTINVAHNRLELYHLSNGVYAWKVIAHKTNTNQFSEIAEGQQFRIDDSFGKDKSVIIKNTQTEKEKEKEIVKPTNLTVTLNYNSAVELFGNRIIFLTLFIVALIAWAMQRKLNESEEWQEAKKTSAKQPSVFGSFSSLFKNAVNVRTILYLAGIYITWNFVAGVMGMFQPHIFETAGGLTNSEANMLPAIQWLIIVVVTYFGFAMFVDKVNQRWFYFIGTFIGVMAWIILVTVGIKNLSALWTFTVLWGVHAGLGVQAFYALWASELFPAKYRAAAQGVMFFAVRGGAAIWSIIFTGIYASAGFNFSAYIMIGFLIIALVVGTIWAPKTRGKSLKQITKERYGDEM